MTTISDLSRTMNVWLRWLRVQRAAAWALRGLIGGLALALAAGLLGMLGAWLLRAEFIALVVALALILPLIAGIVAGLWPVDPFKAARYFDRVFHLNERVSTALELNRQHKKSDLIQQQLDDAVHAARAVEPARALPLRLQTREVLLTLILALLLGLTWFKGDELFQAAQQQRAVQQAADAQAAKIEQILTQVKNNDTLTEEQKKALSAPLEQALNELKNNPSQEGAVSALTSAGEKLQALTDPQAQQMAQALKEAGGQAATQKGSPLQAAGQKLAQGNTVGAATDLANTDVSKLSAAQSQALANQLEKMSQTMASTNPQLAADLKAAAQALKNGDSAKAQQALDKAAQSLANAGQQVAQSQAAGQAAQQMQQGAGQMLAAGGSGQQQTAQSGQGQGQGNGSSGSGSGQGTSQSSSGAGQEAGASPIPQTNGPGNGGESAFEQIYAPTFLGGNGGQLLPLPNSGQQGQTIGQGPTTPGNLGQSLVPYQQVYSQYDQSYHQAIESGNIPFAFLDTIRNYFDSLKP